MRRLKKALCLFFLLAITCVEIFAGGIVEEEEAFPVIAELNVSAKAAIVIEAQSGQVIYEKNADERLPIASTTKIMTAVVALENYDISKTVSVAEEAVGVEGSSVYLYPNEKLSMENLIYAVMLESANDAATAVAIEVAGSVEKFAAMMNNKAEELGLSNTHFTNPHGLDDENHYSTARDLAKLTEYALKNSTFKGIVSTYKRIIPLQDDKGARLLINHNRLLRQFEGAIGVKTGYTKKSGRCLVSAAEKNGVTLVAVTLNDPNDWKDHTNMLNSSFSEYKKVVLCKKDQYTFDLPVINGESDTVKGVTSEELSVIMKNEASENISETLHLKRFYYADINKGDILGHVVYSSNGEVIGKAPIVAQSTVSSVQYKKGFFKRIFGFIFGD